MKYWDSSAVLPLLVAEQASTARLALYRADPAMITWWATRLECASALARLSREGALSPSAVKLARRRLDDLAASWQEIQPVAMVRLAAERLLWTHPLRAADAAQLAAAIAACDGQPERLPFACADVRLSDAARREGFEVVP